MPREKRVDPAAIRLHRLLARMVLGHNRRQSLRRAVVGAALEDGGATFVHPKGPHDQVALDRPGLGIHDDAVGVKLQVHRPRRHDRYTPFTGLLEHERIELHAANGMRGDSPLRQLQRDRSSVQHILIDHGTDEMVGECQTQVGLEQVGERRGKDSDALIVMALADELFALQDRHREMFPLAQGGPLQRQGACDARRTSSKDDHVGAGVRRPEPSPASHRGSARRRARWTAGYPRLRPGARGSHRPRPP